MQPVSPGGEIPGESRRSDEGEDCGALLQNPPGLLIVTGSRSLARLPGAEAWVRRHVGLALDDLGPACVLLHGGAIGVDRMAGEVALARHLRVVTYLPDGRRLDTHRAPSRWAEGDPGPLPRNDAMLAAGVRSLRAGYVVRVLGLRDPGSRTGGTGYTLRGAARAGLPWVRVEWPG